jgi:hypothetical protein
MTLITGRSLRSPNEGNSGAQWETHFFSRKQKYKNNINISFDEIKEKRSVTKWPSHASGYIRATAVLSRVTANRRTFSHFV